MLKVTKNNQTGNYSMIPGVWVEKNITILEFSTPESWYAEWKKNPGRVRRYNSYQQFGDDNGRYTEKMAVNDFKKHAK